MQTFLPSCYFDKSARILDPKRLLNQRNEALILLKSLHSKRGWYNHPAAKMWEGYEDALREYYNCIVSESVTRGYKNSMPRLEINCKKILYPWWLGYEPFHASHRSNLLRKDERYYRRFMWHESKDMPYIWPSQLK